MASRVAQWSKALHRSASCATTDAGFESRLCRSRPRTGDPWGGAQLVQCRPGKGRVWSGGYVLVPSRTCDSCGGLGAVHADTVARCMVFPLTHWCGWLPGKVGIVSRSSAAWLGCVSEDAQLSTSASLESVWKLQR